LRDYLAEVLGDADLRARAEQEPVEPPSHDLAASSVPPAPLSPIPNAFATVPSPTIPLPPVVEALPPLPSEILYEGNGAPPVAANFAAPSPAVTNPAASVSMASAGATPVPTPPVLPAPISPAAPHQAVDQARRRRRSASLLQPVHSPTDIPDDAPGRVEFFIPAVGPDILPAPSPGPVDAPPTDARAADAQPATATPTGARLADPGAPGQHPDPTLTGWLPVGILAVAMVLIFILGLVITR